jgi:SAM-dependent methyltransferase
VLDSLSIDRLTDVARAVRFTVPFWATTAVMTNDDAELPDLEERPTWKFDVGGEETDIGSAAAGACVERMKADGCAYLVIPSSAYWWLDAKPDFRRYLEDDFRRVKADDDACLIYALQDEEEPPLAFDGLPVPPPEMIALVAGHAKAPEFLARGRLGLTWIVEMLARNGIRVGELESMFDFGCGCGRVLRHWPSVTDAKIHGSDYNPYLIEWCRENLPFAEFAVNGLEPPLPFTDNSFDALYSLSIFTHLAEPLQVPWMQELTRVVKPGGHLLLTFHGRSRLETLTEPFISTFESGELTVWRPEQSGGSGCAVWHPERYIREVLARDVEIVDFSPAAALDVMQDAVLFRKPAT